MDSNVGEEVIFSALFPLPFRVLSLAGLGVLGWATNLHGLELFGIDAPAALNLHNPDNPHHPSSPLPTSRIGWKHIPSLAVYRPVYKLFFTYAFITAFAWLVYRHATKNDILLVDVFKYIPAVISLFMVMMLVSPFNVCYKSERDKFIHSVHRCLFSPSDQTVFFADVVFADVFTSFAKVIGDVWLSLWMLLPGGSLLVQPVQSGWPRWVLPTLMSLPYAVRFRQCIIEYMLPGNDSRRPLYNALKYATSFPVIYLSAAQRIVVKDLPAAKGGEVFQEAWHGEHQLFRLWLLMAAINSLYSFWWDVTNDWGFDLLRFRVWNRASIHSHHPPRPLVLPRLHSRSSLIRDGSSGEDTLAHESLEEQPTHHRTGHNHKPYPFGLRSTLLFPLPVYPFAILVDLVLRLTWSVKLSSHLHSYGDGDLFIFWLEMAEMVRRWMWVFFRVEWEVVKQRYEGRGMTPTKLRAGANGLGDYAMLPPEPDVSSSSAD